jgi:hypothetical protein
MDQEEMLILQFSRYIEALNSANPTILRAVEDGLRSYSPYIK